jgi:hypothetical protein
MVYLIETFRIAAMISSLDSKKNSIKLRVMGLLNLDYLDDSVGIVCLYS